MSTIEDQQQQIRQEAVAWLEDELNYMNGDGGKHWIRRSYAAFMEGGEVGMCIKGASNRVLVEKTGLLEKLRDWFGGSSEDSILANVLGESSKIRDMVVETEDTTITRWLAVQDAVEIALNMAIAEAKEANYEGLSKPNSAEDGESNITDFNDGGAEWNDIVSIHERAKVLVQGGDSPLEWSDLGQWLADRGQVEEDGVAGPIGDPTPGQEEPDDDEEPAEPEHTGDWSETDTA